MAPGIRYLYAISFGYHLFRLQLILDIKYNTSLFASKNRAMEMTRPCFRMSSDKNPKIELAWAPEGKSRTEENGRERRGEDL